MKKIILYSTFLSLIFVLLFTSCGPSKKLTSSRAKVEQLYNDSINTNNLLNDCNILVRELNQEKAAMLEDEVNAQNEKKIMQQENALIQNNLIKRSTESKMTIAEQARRLNDLQDIINNQTEITTRLKNSIANALMNYKTDELNVYIQDGNVYVSLAEKLLFKSGSDVVDPKGKEALKSLASVLNRSDDFTVAIEGHTDSIPIQTKIFEDNWDLSTARATSIVRILTKGNGFDSSRITASGRGQFHPVKSNDTAEGRSFNRRTEVILSPNLNEIYKLLYQ